MLYTNVTLVQYIDISYKNKTSKTARLLKFVKHFVLVKNALNNSKTTWYKGGSGHLTV